VVAAMNKKIIYSNSCSFGAPQDHLTYSEIIAERLGYSIHNNGRPSSGNRRIIRTSLRSLIELKAQGHNNIIALIGLSYIGRTELWQPHLSAVDNDGDFHPITNQQISNIVKDGVHCPDVHKYADIEVREYYKQWLGHMSKEAIVVNLISDIIMLRSFARANNIDILFFCNCEKLPGLPEVDTSAIFLSSLIQHIDNDLSIIDLWNFSFRSFALELGHDPKDIKTHGIYGHPGYAAHLDFANFLLENHIKF
jgi:hypothetical protein